MRRSRDRGSGLVLLVLFAAVAFVGCNRNDSWEFSAVVVSADAEKICMNLVDGGPGYINNGCLDRSAVVDLPDDVGDGECIRLNQPLHADLVYLERTEC